MSYSRDGGVTITRICGMVGVGKTTLDGKIGRDKKGCLKMLSW